MNAGEIYALTSGLLWSFSVILMRLSGFTIPAIPLTFFKVTFAAFCFALLISIRPEQWVSSLSLNDYLRLILSAVLGITIADTMIVAALNKLGASLHALADCAYTPAISLVGFLMFGELLSSIELVGGLLVISGVFIGATVTHEVKNSRDLWISLFLCFDRNAHSRDAQPPSHLEAGAFSGVHHPENMENNDSHVDPRPLSCNHFVDFRF